MLTKSGIEQYFIAQKQAGLIFLLTGIVVITVAAVTVLIYKTPFWKGAAIPLIVIGCMQLAAGYKVFKESDDLRISNVYAFDMNPQQLRDKELPRMKGIQQKFEWYKWVQWLLLAAGVILAVVCRNNLESRFWLGLGLALCIQAIILITVYYMAARRAGIYTQKLEQFLQQFS